MVSHPVQATRPPHGPRPAEDAVGALCQAVFESLPRTDQRRKAELYVRGLLATNGRKSIRNIAAHVGIRAGEQSLHHFVSCSTWDWRPVRETLAAQVDGMLNLQAWVVKPLVIPKSGDQSVGMGRRFDARRGQMVTGQQAYGAWGVCEDAAVPVNWSLHLPDEEALADCAGRAVLDLADSRALRRLPVVVGAEDVAPERVTGMLAAAGLPFVAQVAASARLTVTDPQMPHHHGEVVTAGTLMESARLLRRPISHPGPHGGRERVSLVAAVQVELECRTAGPRPLLLLGEWSDPRRPADRYWLTDLLAAPPAVAMRLARLADRADRSFAQGCDRVGLRDFEGRSFNGWHRHMTLASAAYAASLFPSAGRAPVPWEHTTRGRAA